MSRQQRRYEARKGVREIGFTPVPSGKRPTVLPPELWNTARARRSKSDDPAYRKSIWPTSKIERRFERECFEAAARRIAKSRIAQ